MSTQAFAPNPFMNPFIANSVPFEVEVEEDPSKVSYALVQSGPAVPSEEVESHLDAVEVKVSWGTQVLAVKHLDDKSGYAIGEGGDFVLPEVTRSAIVERRGGASFVVVPPGATATSKGAIIESEVMLTEGMTVTIELAPVTIEVSAVRAGKKLPVGFLKALAGGAAGFIGLSFLGHTAIVAAMAMFMPAMNADDAEAISRDQILKMQTMLNASAEREQEQIKQDAAGEESNGGGSVGGEPHKGEAGAAGTTKPVTTQGHMAFKGSDNQVRLSRKEELQMAAEGGFVGILLAGAPQTGHSSPWATDTQLGQDADNKLGSMFGIDANDMAGYGLGLSSTGEGGGGNGAGIGIDGIGNTVGGGGGGPGKWGYGKGDKNGWGIGHGPGQGGHVAKAPSIRPPTTIVTSGSLPPEVIQRIVRQNFGRFRLCYEAGLRNNPALTGRVVTKFVIGRDGAVAQAADAGSDLPNQEVTSCVVRSFGALSFPEPKGGIATVVYPITLSPGE